MMRLGLGFEVVAVADLRQVRDLERQLRRFLKSLKKSLGVGISHRQEMTHSSDVVTWCANGKWWAGWWSGGIDGGWWLAGVNKGGVSSLDRAKVRLRLRCDNRVREDERMRAGDGVRRSRLGEFQISNRVPQILNLRGGATAKLIQKAVLLGNFHLNRYFCIFNVSLFLCKFFYHSSLLVIFLNCIYLSFYRSFHYFHM
ncbi:hypothetical protein U1Q18_005893 [Sarracenia purpurea var. burkii]